jgi:hypothetical protein
MASHDYEAWLASQIEIIKADLAEKHLLMCDGPSSFFRATFYRWIQVCDRTQSDTWKAPAVLAVGDLHIENFGTWRDAEGRLVWGINDFDESFRLPYTNDLVRLATSVLLAMEERNLGRVRRPCNAILDGYRDGLKKRGQPFVLSDRNAWLREIAMTQLKSPEKFWSKLSKAPSVKKPAAAPVRILKKMLPPGLDYQLLRRTAGIGSRGHVRYVAIASSGGGRIAREVKELAPSGVIWARGLNTNRRFGCQTISRSIRVHDPFYLVSGNWVVRRLAPDCIKLDIKMIPRQLTEELLYSMGWETANVHLGSGRAIDMVAKDLEVRGAKWLARAASEMASIMLEDWREWRTNGYR